MLWILYAELANYVARDLSAVLRSLSELCPRCFICSRVNYSYLLARTVTTSTRLVRPLSVYLPVCLCVFVIVFLSFFVSL
jgi:hypothetical protein